MPKRKQANGAGSITQRSDGRWMGRICVGFQDNGKLNRKTYYGKTKKEVQDKMVQSMHEINMGTYLEPQKISVESWLNTWLFEYKHPSVRATTFSGYELNVRRNLIPYIGKIQLKDLRPEHVQRLYNQLSSEKELSPKTVRNIHNLLHEALEQAIKNNLVMRNPTEAATLPHRNKPEMRVLTVEEQSKILEAVHGHRLEMAFRLDLATGLRLSELVGLRWQDVDLDEGIIRISQTIYRTTVFDKNKKRKTQILFEEPKSKSGNRSIPLPTPIIEDFKRYKKEQDELKEIIGSSFNPYELVFTSQNGTPMEPRSIIRLFHIMVEKAGIEHANFHSLRHSFATRLLEANEHVKVVQEMLGHANIAMTLDTYSHVLPDKKKAAAEKLNHLFERTADAESDEAE